jgi:hypothetical protein
VVGCVHLVMQRPSVILKLLSNKKPFIEKKEYFCVIISLSIYILIDIWYLSHSPSAGLILAPLFLSFGITSPFR